MNNIYEHPTERIRYLKRHGVVTYNLLTPVDPRSICWLCIQVKTPIDPLGKCSVRIGRIDVNFMDEYMMGTIYDECPIEITIGIKELKAFRAFPEILNSLTDINGTTITIKDMCKKLEQAGIIKSNEESVDQYLEFNKPLLNRLEMPALKSDKNITGDPTKDCFILCGKEQRMPHE